MKKKIIPITVFCLLLIVCLLAAFFCKHTDVVVVNSEQFEFIKKYKHESRFFPLETVSVCGVSAYESKGDSWWLYSIQDNTDISNLKFSFTNRWIASKIAVESQVIDENFFKENKEIRILVYSFWRYKEYTLYITTLPVFTLNTDADTLTRDDEIVTFNGIKATAHLRGDSSTFFDKPGYLITLNKKTSFLGMREDVDWVLYGGFNDQERVRNVFSTNLWYNSCAGNNAFSVCNGSEYRYIELFYNGKYAGLYALGYKPDQKQFEIKDGEFLFKKTGHSKNEFELCGGKTKTREADAWNALEGEYSEDIASAIDYWLFVNLCAGEDNIDKNYYVALKDNNEQFVAVYSPWDLDLTWGNEFNNQLPYLVDKYAIDTDIFFPNIGIRISESIKNGDEDTIRQLKKRYNELRKNEWSNRNLEKTIREFEKMIFDSGAYRRDILRWTYCIKMDRPEIGLEYFKDYVLIRANQMDSMIDAL